MVAEVVQAEVVLDEPIRARSGVTGSRRRDVLPVERRVQVVRRVRAVAITAVDLGLVGLRECARAADVVNITLNTAFSGKMLNEFRAQIARDREPGTANSDLPEAEVRQSLTALLRGLRENEATSIRKKKPAAN